MKRSLTLLPALLLVFGAAGAFAQTAEPPPPPPLAIEATDKAWKTVAPTDAGFSVLMPGEPVRHGQVIESDLGPLPYFTFVLKTQLAEYMVSYSDFPFAVTEAKDLRTTYDGARDKMKQIEPFKLSGERDITIEGRPGRELVFESAQGVIKARLLLVNRRLFQTLIMTRRYQDSPPPTAKLYEAAVNKFLSSFKLTDLAVTNKQEAKTDTALAQIDPGRIENSTYINPYFGFSISFPPTWHASEQATSKAIAELGKERIKDSNPKLGEALDKSPPSTLYLFTLSNVPVDSPSGIQAALQCGIEKISVPGMTGSTYINSAKRLILATNLGYRVTRDVETQVIGGQTFYLFQTERTLGDILFKQKYYARVQKGFALFFIASYISEEDRLVLEKTMQSLKFE